MIETPAAKALRLFGVKALREITGAGTTSIYRWTHPKERGGTGGLIPQQYHHAILQAAIESEIDFTTADLVGWPPNRALSQAVPECGAA